MRATLSIKKQLKFALYTSPVIGTLAITPITIMDRYSFDKWLVSVISIMVLALTLWGLNILLWRLTGGRATKRYIISILVNLVLAWAVSMFAFHAGHHTTFFQFHMILFLSIDTVILILQDLLVTREKKAAIELENQALRLKNMEAVNQQLKQQIQPHFLFNSLSTLKSLMTVNPEDAEEYLVRLSEFLRSSLSSHAHDSIRLADEVHLCLNYLEMQKIRFGDALQFDVQVPEEWLNKYYLPAFSLQQLAENAIKHNVLTLDRPLRITITGHEGVITVKNNWQKKEGVTQGPGVGLANLQERYRILSGSDIVIEAKDDVFSVSIKALAYESSDH
ncbi:MAG TPA: histidine kinase [Puia sp.]|jgi:LytS/YehU family sensor histidine kinase